MPENIDITKQLSDGRIVLCGASAYDEKYFFNPDFGRLPEQVKEELRKGYRAYE